MQELPCAFINGITSNNNNHKCVLVAGDSTYNIPVRVMITGFTLSNSFEFYIAGIYNPTTTNKYVSVAIKLY